MSDTHFEEAKRSDQPLLTEADRVLDDTPDISSDFEFQEMARRGKLMSEALNGGKRSAPKNAYLADESFEDVSVWICNEDDLTSSNVHDKEAKRIQEKHRLYKHNHFNGREWAAYEKNSAFKDEEWFISNPPIDSKDDLCSMCRHINFTVLFTTRDLPASSAPVGNTIQFLGVDKMIQNTGCSFCRLVTRKLRADGVWDLKDEALLRGATAGLNVLDEGEGKGFLRLEFQLQAHMRQLPTQTFVIQAHEADDLRYGFKAMDVQQEQIATDRLNSWLKYTEAVENPAFDLGRDMTRLRLIDLDQNCVRQVSLPCRYACLSYVWGGISQTQNVTSFRDRLYKPGGLCDPSLQLPLTIADAIRVTRDLKIPYLWIDALCIEQDNPEDKKEVISQMTSIYGSSSLTIVASSNQTPLDGLPGVSSAPRTRPQISEVVQGMKISVAFQDIRLPISGIEETKWNTRGWTCQERHLSSRLLFFTDAQMIFACGEQVFFEDTLAGIDYRKVPPLDEYHGHFFNPEKLIMRVLSSPGVRSQHKRIGFKNVADISYFVFEQASPKELLRSGPMIAPVYDHKIFHADKRGVFLARDQVNFWNLYRNVASMFTLRDLTVQSDVIPAFLGLSELMRQNTNIDFHYNIPDCAFDQGLLWYPTSGKMKRRVTQSERAIPSWTWAGWEGPISYRGRGWRNALYSGPTTAVRWLRNCSVHGSREEHIESLTAGMDAVTLEIWREKLRNVGDVWEPIPPKLLFNFDATKKGWRQVLENERNQVAYFHDAYKQANGSPFMFNYPIPLPGEEKVVLPENEGNLRFVAYAAHVRFVDMKETPHIRQPGVDRYLQIGLNDEHRHGTPLSSWQRIIYHQGYRAGFLALNVQFESIDASASDKYRLIAMSRDDLPFLPPGLDDHPRYSPWALSRVISCPLYYDMSAEALNKNIPPPNQDVDPSSQFKPENSDAHWDDQRFGTYYYPLYNVLLVQKREGGGYERIGVGKMHWLALHHADADTEVIKLF